VADERGGPEAWHQVRRPVHDLPLGNDDHGLLEARRLEPVADDQREWVHSDIGVGGRPLERDQVPPHYQAGTCGEAPFDDRQPVVVFVHGQNDPRPSSAVRDQELFVLDHRGSAVGRHRHGERVGERRLAVEEFELRAIRPDLVGPRPEDERVALGVELGEVGRF
jgi:hypothetical protein